MKSFLIPVAALSLALLALTARAALIPVDGGRLVDDTADDTLWVADANLFKTLANAGGDPTAFLQKVIAAAGGMVADTPCQWDTPAYSGRYTLTVSDFATDSGHLTWYGAQAFIAYLNSIRYLGYSDWRQPVTLTPFNELLATGTAPGDVAPTSGELSELFYTELGARISNGAYLNSVNGYGAVFRNLQDSYYYATEGTADPGTAGLFLFGYNVEHIKIGGNKDPAFAWPMRRGQASTKELIGAVAAQVEPADGDGRTPLSAAEKQLQRGCEDLTSFLKRESQSKDVLLDADVKAIGKAIGCQ
jgi:hypothetical protein